MRVRIRPFRDSDAGPLAEWLDSLAPADDVWTTARLIHQRRMVSRAMRPLWLVAVTGGEPVGFGHDEPQLFDGEPGLRRIWLAVRPDLRRRGIGSRLWEQVEAHTLKLGARKLRSWAVSDQPDGERFLRKCGFKISRGELQSWIDPTAIDRELLKQRRAQAEYGGFRGAVLRDLMPQMESQLWKLFVGATYEAPGSAPRPSVSERTFHRAIVENPTLDPSVSTVVFKDETPVALCWLKGDRGQARYGIEFTGTAPDWRGQGLATFAKLEALELAANAGITWVGTTNDRDNVAMLAVNHRLGSRPLPDLNIYEREI